MGSFPYYRSQIRHDHSQSPTRTPGHFSLLQDMLGCRFRILNGIRTVRQFEEHAYLFNSLRENISILHHGGIINQWSYTCLQTAVQKLEYRVVDRVYKDMNWDDRRADRQDTMRHGLL